VGRGGGDTSITVTGNGTVTDITVTDGTGNDTGTDNRGRGITVAAGRRRKPRHAQLQNAVRAASPLHTSALLIDESLSMTYFTPRSPTAL